MINQILKPLVLFTLSGTVCLAAEPGSLVKSQAVPATQQKPISFIQKKTKTVVLNQTLNKTPDQKPKPVVLKKPGLKVSNNVDKDYLKPAHYSILAEGGAFTNLHTMGVEGEYRLQKFGFGLFLNKQTAFGAFTELTGTSFGASAHYYFFPYWYTAKNKVFSPGVYARVGFSKFTSSTEGDLPIYPCISFGADLSYKLMNHVNAYSRIGLDYISHFGGVQYFGSELTVGFKFSF